MRQHSLDYELMDEMLHDVLESGTPADGYKVPDWARHHMAQTDPFRSLELEYHTELQELVELFQDGSVHHERCPTAASSASEQGTMPVKPEVNDKGKRKQEVAASTNSGIIIKKSFKKDGSLRIVKRKALPPHHPLAMLHKEKARQAKANNVEEAV